jgi:uncharacterized protein YdeI (YjbR/CyaY-like superfamily)
MGTQDKRVDAYIAASADFARPVLQYIRRVVHAACPQVQETIKWRFPHFMYDEGILCSMAAFKQHCAFGFWHPALRKPQHDGQTAMGQYGRISSIEDLPKEPAFKRAVKDAMKLNESGVKPARPKKAKARAEIAVPKSLADALKKNPKAKAAFDGFSYSHRKEYVQWLEEAKREETRQKRLATAVHWLAQGKPRNWKYEKR